MDCVMIAHWKAVYIENCTYFKRQFISKRDSIWLHIYDMRKKNTIWWNSIIWNGIQLLTAMIVYLWWTIQWFSEVWIYISFSCIDSVYRPNKNKNKKVFPVAQAHCILATTSKFAHSFFSQIPEKIKYKMTIWPEHAENIRVAVSDSNCKINLKMIGPYLWYCFCVYFFLFFWY